MYQGNRYTSVNWGSSGSNVNYCFKYYPLTGNPHPSVLFLNTSSCPSGYLSLSVASLKGTGTMYLGESAYSLWLGGANPGVVDSLYGYLYNYINSADASTVCLRVDNVASFP